MIITVILALSIKKNVSKQHSTIKIPNKIVFALLNYIIISSTSAQFNAYNAMHDDWPIGIPTLVRPAPNATNLSSTWEKYNRSSY